MKKKIVVVGSGVQGLSCAFKLLETGQFDVEVISESMGLCPPHSLWEMPPFNVEPEFYAVRWAWISFGEFLSLRERYGEEASGVCFPVKYFQLSRTRVEENPHGNRLRNYRHGAEVLNDPILLKASPNANKIYADADVYDTIIVDTRKLLNFFIREIKSMGGTITNHRKLGSLSEISGGADLVVNCSGLGSKDLCQDDLVFPIKGQILQIDMPNVKCAMTDIEKHATTIPLPNATTMVELGTTTEPDVWDRNPNPVLTEQLLENAKDLLPFLDEPDFDIWTGIRPARKSGLCFKFDRDARVIHNYGHGGAGVITCFGAANDIVNMCLNSNKL